MVLSEEKSAPSNPSSPGSSAQDNAFYEVARVVFGGLCLALLLCLLSYSSADTSWSTWTSSHIFHNWMGRVGSFVADALMQLFGVASFSICYLILAKIFSPHELRQKRTRPFFSFFVQTAVLLPALSSGVALFAPAAWHPWELRNAGGLIGFLAARGLTYLLSPIGARLFVVIVNLVVAILLFRFRLSQVTTALRENYCPKTIAFFKSFPEKTKSLWKSRRPMEIPIGIPTLEPVFPATPIPVPQHQARVETIVERDEEISRLAVRRSSTLPSTKAKPAINPNCFAFQLPPVSSLTGRAESKPRVIEKEWYLEKGNILVQKLKDFGVEGEIVHISPGPVITVYEFKPASGVKIKEIANLSDDLTLALSVLSVRIVAPIPGKPVVGIEIPSPSRETVFFKDLIEETPFFSGDVGIPIVLGRLASGEPVVAGLASMPHLLVAGSTGTGKSVFINTLICSLLFRYTPNQLKLILVDPKMVELSSYEGIPHLLLPVVVDSKKAALALRWAVDEMERRYALLHQLGVRHIDLYNARLSEKTDEKKEPLPYIVVVIDEYADLMAVVPKDVELSIARLAQKARASGIHLVLATQRPSTDVVTGTIKANFPSRISFRVASSVDSKTILDRTGADRLLGQGDMLFHSAGFLSLKRMQGAFISDGDITRIVEFLKAQGAPQYDEKILQQAEQSLALENDDSGGDDQLFRAAVQIVTEKGEASISLIQRHLRIGYNRAAMLMEQMEKAGIVSPESAAAGKRRTVLAKL